MDINVKNVAILISFMEGLNDPRFDMSDFFHTCGTPSCALGWATTIPEFAPLLKKSPAFMADAVFGLDAYYYLFNGIRNHRIKTPQQWADHARSFLKANGLADQSFPEFMKRVMKPVQIAPLVTGEWA